MVVTSFMFYDRRFLALSAADQRCLIHMIKFAPAFEMEVEPPSPDMHPADTLVLDWAGYGITTAEETVAVLDRLRAAQVLTYSRHENPVRYYRIELCFDWVPVHAGMRSDYELRLRQAMRTVESGVCH